MRKISSRITALALVFCLCFSMLTVSAGTAAAATAGITYAFQSDASGSAGGTITLCSNTIEGNVQLYWGERGKKLDGYSSLASAALQKGIETIIKIQKFTSIPKGAKQLLVYYNDAPVYELSYTLPSAKITDYGEKLYSFGVVSDVHLPTNDGDPFRKALAFFKDYGCSFVGVSGDIANDGTASQLQMYQNIITPYKDTMPVYVSAGNHDAQGNGIDKTQWESYTGNPLQFTFEKENDVFIFLGDSNWPFSWNDNTIMTDAQLDWLEQQLEANKNKHVYLFQHVFLGGTCGDIQYENGTDVYGNWFDESKGRSQRYRNLMREYSNVTWFNGHSHWKMYLQYMNENLNVFNGDGDYCNMIHVPSLTVPRDFIDQKRIDDASNSEGYIVDVYKDKTVLRGYDFKNKQYYAYANYGVDRVVETTSKVVYLDVAPKKIKILPGNSYQLTVNTVSRFAASEELAWASTDPKGGAITVDNKGLLTVPKGTPYGEYTLTATSVSNPEKSSSVTVTVSEEDGSAAHPFLISSSEDFIQFSNNMDSGEKYFGKYVKQMCDIDLTGTGYNGCNYTGEFLGIYDGNGYKITAKISGAGRKALFGYIGNDTEKGILMNINADVTVSSAEYGSGLAYSVRKAGLAINCYSTSSITASGRASCLFSSVYGYVYNCFGAGTCSGSTNAGVAAQWNNSSSMMKHNYYLDTAGAGSSATSDRTALAPVTAEELKSETFKNTLNSNIAEAQSFLTANGFASIKASDLVNWVSGDKRPGFSVKESDANISEFFLLGKKGEMDGTKIVVKLPKGTDVKSLKPDIKLSGQRAALSPRDEPLDFSQPQQFTVIAENGLKRTFTVEVAFYSVAIKGDVDGDDKVNVSDVVKLRAVIMKGSSTEKELEAGNMDGNTTLDVSDVVALRTYIMKGGAGE